MTEIVPLLMVLTLKLFIFHFSFKTRYIIIKLDDCVAFISLSYDHVSHVSSTSVARGPLVYVIDVEMLPVEMHDIQHIL